MAMTAPDVEIERVELAPASALFCSLGGPARLMIVRRLTAGPARVTDLTSGLGLAQSTVSKHLPAYGTAGWRPPSPWADPVTRPFPPRTIDPVALCTVRTRRIWDLAPT
jgi:regulatory ArsR family protein